MRLTNNNKSLSSFFLRNKKKLLTVAGILFVFLVWWIASCFVTRVIIPGPYATLVRLFELLGSASTYKNLLGTLTRLLIGFGISFLIGTVLGIIAGMYNSLATFLKPLITTLRTLPTAAVILVFITLVTSLNAPYYVVFLAVFPISYEAALSGVSNISSKYMLPLRLEGDKKLNSIFRVILPLSLPYILLGLLTSLGLGMKVEIMSEIIAGNTSLVGVGSAIKTAMMYVEMKDIFAYSIIIIALIGTIEGLLGYLKKRISH